MKANQSLKEAEAQENHTKMIGFTTNENPNLKISPKLNESRNQKVDLKYEFPVGALRELL